MITYEATGAMEVVPFFNLTMIALLTFWNTYTTWRQAKQLRQLHSRIDEMQNSIILVLTQALVGRRLGEALTPETAGQDAKMK